MKLKGSAIGRRATVYIVFVCVLILGLDGWRSWSVHQDRTQELRFMTGSFARIAAQQAQDAFQVAELALQAVGGVVSQKGISAASLAEMVRLMKMDLAIAPQIQGMLIFDADGKLLATTYAPTPPAVNAADRPFFIYHRTHADAGVRINPPIVSRTIGRWVLPLTLRLNQPDGRFGGIVAADIDLEFLRQFYERMIPGTDSVVTLFAEDGTLLLRWPYQTGYFAGSPARAGTLRGLVHQKVEGALIRKSALDGVERFTSFRRLERYPVFVLVGVATHDAFAGWWKDTVLHAVAGVLLVLLISVFGARLVSQIQLRDKAEQELHRANRTLRKLALRDGLTAVANRRQFDEAFADEFGRARQHGYSLALAMLDVDRFKQYNDRYGHLAGDECLKRIAQAMNEIVMQRPGGLVARYGGEEFVVLLPNTDLPGAMIVAEEIRGAVQALGIAHIDNSDGVVTLSAGVNAYRPVRERDDYNTLLYTADSALYEAKRAGRNRVCRAAPSANTPSRPTGLAAR